jgi:hypothetical protein
MTKGKNGRKRAKNNIMLKKHKKISDRKKVYNIVSNIYKELKNNQRVSFKRLKGYQGEYDYCGDEITIDYRREILPTLIHEFLHKWHPTKSESWVLNMERFVIQRISPSQAKRLLANLSFIA